MSKANLSSGLHLPWILTLETFPSNTANCRTCLLMSVNSSSLEPQSSSNYLLYILKRLTSSLEDLSKVPTQFIWNVWLRFPGMRYQMIFMSAFQPEILWDSVESVYSNSIAKNLTERTGKWSTDINKMLKEALCRGITYSSKWQKSRCITAIAVSIECRHFIFIFLLFYLSQRTFLSHWWQNTVILYSNVSFLSNTSLWHSTPAGY